MRASQIIRRDQHSSSDLRFSADTVVVYPPIRDPNTRQELGADLTSSEILEKPASPGDNVSAFACSLVGPALTLTHRLTASHAAQHVRQDVPGCHGRHHQSASISLPLPLGLY